MMRPDRSVQGIRRVARLFPSDLDLSSIESRAEAQTVAALRDGLPDDWWVVHSCHWTLPRGHGIGQGEIDVVVVSPSGAIALIEQKNGAIEVADNDYVKRYPTRTKSVSRQMARNRVALLGKFEAAQAIKPVGVVSVLYFPDARVTRLHGAGLDALSMVDHDEAPRLADRIWSLIGSGDADPERVRSILAFFEGELGLEVSVHAIDQASAGARIHLLARVEPPTCFGDATLRE